VLWEWNKLSRRIAASWWARLVWLVAGVVYVGVACEMLLTLRAMALALVLAIVGAVVATDIGAYFAGRTFGGPKIAPKISPSKTWSGLIGGAIGAFAVVHYSNFVEPSCLDCSSAIVSQMKIESLTIKLVGGLLIAIIAQTGDFFESWMKRRAGVKDSGNLIPGHGGLFDRVDGLLAVLFVAGLLGAVGRL
jgi:phosphatidate cytidylyltransferase